MAASPRAQAEREAFAAEGAGAGASSSSRSGPRASRGPFDLNFKGCNDRFFIETPWYKIHVYGSDGEHVISRRYSHFKTLIDRLTVDGLPDGAELPAFPPKSFFRKTFRAKFLLQRAACLRRFLLAVLESDLFVTSEALSDFLAVPKPSKRSWKTRAKVLPVSWKGGSSALSTGDGFGLLADTWNETVVTEDDSEYENGDEDSGGEDSAEPESRKLATVSEALSFREKPLGVSPSATATADSLSYKEKCPSEVSKGEASNPGRMERARAKMCLLTRA